MQKEDIRRAIRARKAMLDDDERTRQADDIFARLEQMAAFVVAERILMYHSLPDEVPTPRFLEKWATRKRFFLPRVNGVNLDILPYDRTRLALGSFHIEEPQGDDLCPVDDIDLIIVPGVAFDRSGNRLGRGRGYYDRLLQSSRAVKIGIGYSFQLVDEVPAEEHDIPMDFVIVARQ